jgi:hypothetical protein
MKWLPLILLAGCTASKTPVDDDLALFAADLKSDLPTSTKNLGRVPNDGTVIGPYYTSYNPKYRSFDFGGVSGDPVTIWVRATDGGDAVAWLFDFEGKLIAKNDDASDDSTDSLLITTLTPSNGHYALFIRDYYRQRRNFTISVKTGHPTGRVGAAERAYDAAAGDLESYAIDPGDLPGDAAARSEVYATHFGNAYSYRIPGDYYVVAASGEEIYWLDLYDKSGRFIVHGFSGDGGPDITFWGPPPSFDPSRDL